MQQHTKLQNFHVLTVSVSRGSAAGAIRVKIRSDRFKTTKSISCDYSFNNTIDIAQDYLTKRGFEIVGMAEGKDCYYLISTTFENVR